MWTFYKMSGAGNDFVALPAAEREPTADEVRTLCRRSLSIGADGVFRLSRTDGGVRMVHWNADGGRAELCLNGSRCAAQLAFHLGWADGEVTLETDAGPLQASAVDASRTRLCLPPFISRPETVHLPLADGKVVTAVYVEVGVPHLVLDWPEALDTVPLGEIGPPLRAHADLPKGANVNVVHRVDEHRIGIRTWERGVEAETLACGTGTVAAVASGVASGRLLPPVTARTAGGFELVVDGRVENGRLVDPALAGDARLVSRGEILDGAFALPRSS